MKMSKNSILLLLATLLFSGAASALEPDLKAALKAKDQAAYARALEKFDKEQTKIETAKLKREKKKKPKRAQGTPGPCGRNHVSNILFARMTKKYESCIDRTSAGNETKCEHFRKVPKGCPAISPITKAQPGEQPVPKPSAEPTEQAFPAPEDSASGGASGAM